MEDFSKIINWENVFQNSTVFKKNKPFKFAFIEDLFYRDYYEKLYETYPTKDDENWIQVNAFSKNSRTRYWTKDKGNQTAGEEDDPSLSPEWNKFKRYTQSKEFIENFRKFSGVKVNKLKFIIFIANDKGGFQVSHIHNVGPSTLVMMLYFSKGWKKGDPGGTYMATKPDDESSIIFEPYNLDNSMALFQDGPNAAHGVRYIEKDVERRALQITLEGYSATKGWTGGNTEMLVKERLQKAKNYEA